MITHFNHWWAKLLLLAAALILFSTFVSGGYSGKYSGCGGCSKSSEPSNELPNYKTIKFQIDCCRWSDWISLPPGTKFKVDAPGWHEYWFMDGSKKRIENKDYEWLGDIPSSTFKLRGAKGEATITYEVLR